MKSFKEFQQAMVGFKQHNIIPANICLLRQDSFDSLFLNCCRVMNITDTGIPPYLELDGCLILPCHYSNQPDAVLFAHWPAFEIHKRMAELAGELVPLLVDADAIKDGKSVDGGDPLAIKSKHEDAGGKSAERRIGKLVREMRKLL